MVLALGDLALGSDGGVSFWPTDIHSSRKQIGSVLTYSASLVFLERFSGLFAIPERNQVTWFTKRHGIHDLF